MSFGKSIQTVFTKYAEFQGTAGRSEFWWWILFTALVSAVLGSVPVWGLNFSDGISVISSSSSLAGLWTLAVLLPSLAVTVRRLRDARYQWRHIFWLLLPVAGMIVLIVLCAQPTRHIVGATAEGTARAQSLP